MSDGEGYQSKVAIRTAQVIGYAFVALTIPITLVGILLTIGQLQYPDYETSSCNKEFWYMWMIPGLLLNGAILMFNLFRLGKRSGRILSVMAGLMTLGLFLPRLTMDYVAPPMPGTCL